VLEVKRSTKIPVDLSKTPPGERKKKKKDGGGGRTT